MRMKNSYKSDAFEAIHSAVAGMIKSGTVSKVTLQEFDDLCRASLTESKSTLTSSSAG